ACVHGEFFGSGSVVVFDSVSLNISGDIFYSEGDLRRAIKEYRLGLECNPADINLLNSLGVAYVFIDQHNKGEKCFAKVLKEEPDNFMALFNLGLEGERKGQYAKAVKYFEQAWQVFTPEEGDEVLLDLDFHLARLYCLTGKYKKAAEKLDQLVNNKKNRKYTTQIYRYLGLVNFNLGQKKEAVKWLQRSLQINEFDAEAMSLLGFLYFELDQGGEIALSLCEKSVELEPKNVEYLLRLAKVQLKCERFEQALENLKKCLRSKGFAGQAHRHLAEYYELKGNKARAAYWKKKL
ncbi:MAG: hypothetical protein CSB24_06105, partial [Deltaproteobacteria bacterium]